MANGTEPLEAVVAIDVLRRAGAEVTVASVEEQLRVDACHGVKIVADALISDCAGAAFDLISLPVCVQYASPASLRSLRVYIGMAACRSSSLTGISGLVTLFGR